MASDNYITPEMIPEHLGLRKLDDLVQEICDNSLENTKDNTEVLKAKIIQVGEVCKRTRKQSGKDSFKKIRIWRNELAHDVGEVKPNRIIEMAKYIKNEFFKTINALLGKTNRPKDQKSFEKRAYIGETQEEREELVDNIELTLLGEEKLGHPSTNVEIKQYDSLIENLSENKELTDICQDNNVRTEILSEVLNHINSTQKKRRYSEVPYQEEMSELEMFKSSFKATSEPKEWIEQIARIKKEYKNDDFPMDFIQKEILEIYKKKRGWQRELKKMKTYISSFWEKLIVDKQLKFELELIDRERQHFLKQLFEKVDHYLFIKEKLKPFIEHIEFGRLWDMSSGMWKKTGFNELIKYAELLKANKEVKDLAEMLGKYKQKEKEYEEKLLKDIEFKLEYQYENYGVDELIGISEGNHISNTLPQELALLATDETEDLFYLKYHRKKLMNWEYVSRQSQFSSESKDGVTKQPIPNTKGPIIICVDTSGSMHGAPETIAKTICFALLKIALSENRKCYLISFSTQINSLELTNLENSIDKLIDFLAMSFQGGTDANPALSKAIEMIDNEKYSNADILMISDFVMNDLTTSTIDGINKAKEKKCRFKSLVIGKSETETVIDCFDENWTYNSQNPNQLIKLIGNLKNI